MNSATNLDQQHCGHVLVADSNGGCDCHLPSGLDGGWACGQCVVCANWADAGVGKRATG